MKIKSIMIASILSLYPYQFAVAQVSEIRIGFREFDAELIKINASLGYGDENTLGINGAIIFKEPEFLKWALTPQPYIGGMVNLGGKTSYGATGLLWRQNLGSKFYTDLTLGLSIHNGATEIKLKRPITAQSFYDYWRRLDSEIEFGSRVLLREELTLGYRVTDQWAGEIFIEHMSHGSLLNSKTNDAVDIWGLRVAKRF